RFRSHVFGDTHHGFDLPKSLAVSSVAVRILHTHYDHVSPLWLQCQRVPRLEALDSEELPQHSEYSAGEPEEEKESREEPNVTAEEEMLPDERNSAISFKGNTNSIADANKVTEEKTEKKSETLDVPPEVQIPQTQEKTGEEEEVTDKSTVDLQQFVPVGGVYHIDVLRLPPQVQQINSWSMVELVNGGLEAYPYPPQGPEDTMHPPIQITLGLPNNVMYWKQPVIARWDPAGEQWRTDGISNIAYKTWEKSITFETDAFYTIALLQDIHLNMPYHTWELRPTGTDEALFIITTVFAEVQIQIKDNQCMLAAVDEEKSVLSHLIGKWMCPLTFRRALKKGGLNIFPEEYSYKYVHVNKKAPLTEVRAYQQMALVASAFAFSRSKWNLESGQDQVVFKVREHLKAEFVTDEEWSLYIFNGKRAQKLKITEASEAFSAELEADSEFHSTLYHMLRDSASKSAIDKVNTANFLFVDAVCQLLLATRVLMYS
ncbi:CASC1 protein, partial [Odontophorus gujanensis]|nr:CASC1 protein [Odontophorus gujanensis]